MEIRVYIDSNPLTANEKVYIDSNQLTADEWVYPDANPLTATRRVYVVEYPSLADKRVYLVSSPSLSKVVDHGFGGGGRSFGPKPLYELVLTIWGCWAVLGLIVWAVAGGGGDPHAGRIPLAALGGGALAVVIAALTRIKVTGDLQFFLGGSWVVAGILSVLAHHTGNPGTEYGNLTAGGRSSDWASQTVVFAAGTMFVVFILGVLLVGIFRERWFRRSAV